MRESKNGLPVTLKTDEVEIQDVYWGDMHVSHETYNTAFDVTPLLKGLPDNLDQCPHWGYLLTGEFRNRYKDGREEIVRSGDVYYIEPGHTTIVGAGTEIIEFSPKRLFQETMEVISRNLEATSTDK